MTTLLESLGDHQAPPPGVIFPPNKVTRAMAARVLKRSFSTVNKQSQPGGVLQAETWHGTKLIPVWRIMAELKKQMEAEP